MAGRHGPIAPISSLSQCGELAQLLNQDLALTGMIVQAEIEHIDIFVVIPEEMVAISSRFKLPSLLDLEAYNKIAKHVKEM